MKFVDKTQHIPVDPSDTKTIDNVTITLSIEELALLTGTLTGIIGGACKFDEDQWVDWGYETSATKQDAEALGKQLTELITQL